MKLFSIFFLSSVFVSQVVAYEVTPFDPPISCKAQYRCVGEVYPQGKVTSSGYFWNEKSCLDDLKKQTEGLCHGGRVELLGIQYDNKNNAGIIVPEPVVSCTTQDYYFPYVGIVGSNGGYGAVEAKTSKEAIRKAERACLKHPGNSCRYHAVSPRNGCVGYFYSSYTRQDFFYSGCSSNEIRYRAEQECVNLGCRERKIRCAN